MKKKDVFDELEEFVAENNIDKGFCLYCRYFEKCEEDRKYHNKAKSCLIKKYCR